ncbi:formylmethanofuran dehydrogenase subunit B [Thiocapsa rosea]|uniref:Formylmethanofuran dehydrogenase subunit B n=1 Tax=Thiocapsa rosea TaxID=69360 RepID=A0A495VGX3_9GAMM|nr:formylmethanofuran dehydrogenase subunit B [Thiocapsa rosea]RKT47108.1 formylmethanofuran dehydrogenase subunit B [Thiocapsa rosea]
MWNAEPAGRRDNLTCPFCGLACDNLRGAGDGHLVEPTGCRSADDAFSSIAHLPPSTPAIRGRPVPLVEALQHAAGLVHAAHAPLFAGLVTDVNGMRAVLDLADRCGAVLDHHNGDALFRNLLVLQDGGWMTTTLTEARNRADLILMVGNQCLREFPRLIERVLVPTEALFSSPEDRRLVWLAPPDASPVPTALQALQPIRIPVALEDLAGVAGILRGMLSGRPVRSDAVSGIPGGSLVDLAERLRVARYALVIWAAAELDFPHAELTVQALVELVRDLNETTRAAALPLSGTLGDLTASQVCTWQIGYPLRVGLQQGRATYDPMLNRYQDLIARDECDLLVWVAALPTPSGPPPSVRPTILLGYPGMSLDWTPEVSIPVGLPGIDHPGHWYRTDASCPLPLGRMRDLGLPSVAEVIAGLKERLPC